MDRVGAFFRERTPRRMMAMVVFGAIIVASWKLAPLLIFFVAFQRSLGWASGIVAKRIKVRKKFAALGLVLILVSAVLGAGGVWGTHLFHRFQDLKKDRERLEAIEEHPLAQRLRTMLGGEHMVSGAKEYASSALHVASEVGHIVLYLLIGLILAVVWLLEEEEVHAFREKVGRASLSGTLLRWFGYLADAVAVTIELQFLVAAFNTVTTLPVLVLLGVGHVVPLMVLIFTSALVPVVGNFVAGVVLSYMAYQAKGWVGVAVFVVLTFALHKIESYYLNPRLTSRHVKLPGFVLILSIIFWEHMLGFAGLFVSFPMLFIASKMRAEFLAEDEQPGTKPHAGVDVALALPETRGVAGASPDPAPEEDGLAPKPA